MTEDLAPYACDKCRTRKVSCSREVSGCQRCKKEDTACVYTRSGIIYRNRKRKYEASCDSQAPDTPISNVSGPTDSGVQPHLAADIAATRERLDRADTNQHDSLGALSSLSEACAAVWHGASMHDVTTKKLFLFPDQTASWVSTFIAGLNRGRPLLVPAPPEVLERLKTCRPHQVHDKAWLVMYYSFVLSMVSSTDPNNESTKSKLRCNLWLCLNDARLLLEPSEVNIRALTLVACHVEEFTTPSLCWMLVSNACRMLQALGVNHRRLDPQARERRLILFWHMNLLDKGLALMFGRSPTFHRAMTREIALPTLDHFLSFQPHTTSTGIPAVFGAHYIYQMMLLSRIMGDIWHCLYEDAVPNDRSVESVTADLTSWYNQAKKFLEAASLVEKPFLNTSSAASIDLGLHSLNFTYHYLLILLTRWSDRLKERCIRSSKVVLHLLDNMVSDSEEPFNGIIWHLLCGPFTPFLTLFGEILSSNQGPSEENKEHLAAMERLPVFLNKMSLRNSLAAKLERIAAVFAQHARSIVYPQESDVHEGARGPSIPVGVLADSWPSTGNTLNWDSFFNHAMSVPESGQPDEGNHNSQPEDLESWTYDFFEDAMIDWIGLDNQTENHESNG